ncbi:g13217 [Coccomyxa viridis]|uniref:G13217 protein n=1 Tax=Coccomyxa viridis TaxID=1274662 RepID=A0ABP1GC92_9CHLO
MMGSAMQTHICYGSARQQHVAGAFQRSTLAFNTTVVGRQRSWRRSQRLPVLRPQAVAQTASPPKSASEEKDEGVPVSDLKAQLLDSLFGTERGMSASSEVRAEINELITQLEAKSPDSDLTEAERKLDGQWKLVYTSNSELFGLLALSRLPFVMIGDITQTVQASTLTVENKVQLTVPFSRTSFSTTASFEIRSPKRLQVRFERGTVATPELLQDIELPSSISVLGQPVDLTNLKDALRPAQDAAEGVIQQLARLVSQQPDLQFPIPNDRAQTWLINTYLDEDTRISRGDGGSVFVLVKDVSFPSNLPPSTTAIVPIADAPQASGWAGTTTTPAVTSTITAPAPYLSEVTTDPLVEYCEESPEADECRVYED